MHLSWAGNWPPLMGVGHWGFGVYCVASRLRLESSAYRPEGNLGLGFRASSLGLRV